MSLDLGELLGSVDLFITPFEQKYGRVVGMMSQLGVEASKAGGQTAPLERGLAGVGTSSDTAATGLTRASTAMREAGVSASDAASATGALAKAQATTVDVTTEAGLAQSRLTQATLRAAAAQARLEGLQASGKATAAQLAGAQASVIAANDRVALSNERVEQSMVLGARSADRMGSAWAAIPGPVKLAAAALAVGAVEAVKAAVNYQMLVRNLQTGANESQANLKTVGDGMLHMAGQVGFSADTLAKSMFYVESAGYHGAAGLNLLKIAAEGAKVDFVDLPTMVDALTSAMNAYHEPTAAAARVTNTLIASAAVGKMHLQDLASSLGTVLPSAAALRVPLDQVGAALATMTMQGTNAQRAATYLRFAFAALANPTSKAQAAMAAVGLTSTQVANTMTHGGLPAVFSLLENAVGEKFPAGSAKYLAALANMVGGTRGLQAVLELTGRNLTTMQSNLDSIDGRVRAAGNSVSDWADVQKNFSLQWSEFIDGLGAAGIKIGEDLLPAMTGLLHVLNDTGHAVGAVVGFFDHNTAAAAALGAVLAAVLIPKIIELGVTMTAWAGRAFVAPLVLGFGELVVAMAAADGAVATFGAALEALNINPIILAITAIAAAGTAMWFVLGSGAKAQAAAGARAVDDYVRSLHNLHDSLAASTTDAQAIGQHLSDAIKNLGQGNLDREAGAIIEYGKQLGIAAQAAATMKRNEASLESQFGLSQAQVEQLAQANGINLAGSYQQVAAAIQAAMGPTAQLTADTKTLGKSAQGSANEVTALTDALARLAGNSLSADEAAIAFRNDINDLDKALKKSNGSLSLSSAAGRAARQAFDTAAQGAIDHANAESKLKGGTDKARTSLENEIAILKAHAGSSDYAKAAIGRLESALGSLPGIAHKAGAALSAAAVKAENAGVEFSSGFAAGITAGQAKAIHAAAAMGALSYQAAKNAIQSRSPSRLLRLLGLDGFAAGFRIGIEDGTPGVVAAATRMATAAYQAAKSSVYATIATAVAPAVTDPGALAGTLGVDTSHAISLQQRANELQLSAKAADAAAAAAKRHAQQLSNEAHAAATAAANMTGATKADQAAKHAAEEHSRALATEARTASQAATAATNAATKATNAWNKAGQAAQTAAQKAADAANALVSNLASAADQMVSTVQSFISQISGDLTGDSSLSSIWQSLTGTDANGNPITPTLAGVNATLNGILASAQQFSTDLNQVVAEGGGQDLITQLAGMGTTAGDALAEQLLAAGPAAIAALSATMASIQTVAGTEAQSLANAFYGPGENAIIQFIDGLEAKFPALKKALQVIVNEIEASLGVATGTTGASSSSGSSGSTTKTTKTTKVTKVPQLVTHGFGVYPVGFPHFAAGVREFAGGLAMVGERGPELVTLPRGASVTAHGGTPRGSDGASLFDMSGVESRLDALNARVDRLAEATGQAVGVATLTGYREAGQAHARQLTRDARKR